MNKGGSSDHSKLLNKLPNCLIIILRKIKFRLSQTLLFNPSPASPACNLASWKLRSSLRQWLQCMGWCKRASSLTWGRQEGKICSRTEIEYLMAKVKTWKENSRKIITFFPNLHFWSVLNVSCSWLMKDVVYQLLRLKCQTSSGRRFSPFSSWDVGSGSEIHFSFWFNVTWCQRKRPHWKSFRWNCRNTKRSIKGFVVW